MNDPGPVPCVYEMACEHACISLTCCLGTNAVLQSSIPVSRQKQHVPLAQGQIYALTQKDAENSDVVIIATVFLNNRAAYALFDIRATHSFVSSQIVCLAKIEMKPLENALNVSTLMKNEAQTT